MGEMLLPPGVRDAIDAKRRAFLWSGTDRTIGARCLVAWDNVCRPKEEGGLGVKQLDTQNAALLLKLIHRLHRPGDSAWARWVSARASIHNLTGTLDGDHWNTLRQLLPAYQRITTVEVGDGRTTDFWCDNWAGTTLAELAPALRTHFIVSAPSVRDVVCTGIQNMIQQRLTPQAAREKELLETMLEEVSLTGEPDLRRCCFEDDLQ